MSISTPPSVPLARVAPSAPAGPLWRLSVDQYHAMIRKGILTEDDPAELLEGLLVVKRSKNPPHSVATGLVQDALTLLVPIGWHVQTQDPVTTEDSEPEPDVKVVRGDRRDYVNRHPGPEDVALAVEVSDATLHRDRGVKKRVYARARIPVYLIVNLVENKIEVYTDPSGPGDEPDYRQRQDYGRGDAVPVVIQGQVIGHLPVDQLLP
jgi:Uma2 family endonuclease